MTQKHDAPEGGAVQPVAYMVDCGNTDIAQGDVRFWRAKRKDEAHGCARVFGVECVPLYLAPPNVAPEPCSFVQHHAPDGSWQCQSTETGRVVETKRDGPFAGIPLYRRRGVLAPTPPAPSGLVDLENLMRDLLISDGDREQLRLYFRATLSGQQGGAVPAGDMPAVFGPERHMDEIDAAHTVGQWFDDIALALPRIANEQMTMESSDAGVKVYWRHNRPHAVALTIRDGLNFTFGLGFDVARLAEQPAPAERSKDWWLARARREEGCESVQAGDPAEQPAPAGTLCTGCDGTGRVDTDTGGNFYQGACRHCDGTGQDQQPAPAGTGADGVEGCGRRQRTCSLSGTTRATCRGWLTWTSGWKPSAPRSTPAPAGRGGREC